MGRCGPTPLRGVRTVVADAPAAADTGTVVALDTKKVADTPRANGLSSPRAGQDQRMARGPVRGNAQRGKNAVSYVVGSGLPYKASVTLPADVADKIVTAVRGMDGSIAGMIVTLIERMEVDENGVPVWHQHPDEQQQRLIA